MWKQFLSTSKPGLFLRDVCSWDLKASRRKEPFLGLFVLIIVHSPCVDAQGLAWPNLIKQGIAELESGELSKAEMTFAAALSRAEKEKLGQEDLAKSYLCLGTVYGKEKKLQNAEFCLKKCVAIYEKCPETADMARALLSLACNYMMQQTKYLQAPEMAAPLLERALRISNRRTGLQNEEVQQIVKYLSAVYEKLGKTSISSSIYGILSENSEQDSSVHSSTSVSKQYKEAIQLAAQAEGLLNSGNYSKAEEKLSNAMKLYAGDANVCLNYAVVLSKLGRCSEAVDYFKRSTVLNPTSEKSLIGLANNYKDCGKRENAIQTFQQFLLKFPRSKSLGNVQAALSLLKAEANQGAQEQNNADKKEEDAYRDKLTVSNPVDQAKVESILSLAVDAYYQKKIEKAEELFKSVLALDPKNADANYSLGTILEERGQLEQAASCYKIALSAKPSDSEIAEAFKKITEKLQSKNIDSPEFLKATEEFKRGNYAAARPILEKIVRLEPSNDKANFALGQCLRYLRFPAAGVASIKEAVRLNPSNRTYQQALEQAAKECLANNGNGSATGALVPFEDGPRKVPLVSYPVQSETLVDSENSIDAYFKHVASRIRAKWLPHCEGYAKIFFARSCLGTNGLLSDVSVDYNSSSDNGALEGIVRNFLSSVVCHEPSESIVSKLSAKNQHFPLRIMITFNGDRVGVRFAEESAQDLIQKLAK